MSDDKLKRLADIMAELNTFTLPRRPDKAELNEAQKYIIRHWVRPSATFSARCDYCSKMYSSGFLKLCEKNAEGFCGRKPVEYIASTPTGFTDEELGYYFGLSRSDLDE
jgi:hypothetical protein